MPAILFGSISTLADTSEIQRDAFNQAFQQHGLDWSWDLEEYRDLLASNGGADRIADYAAQRGEDVDAAAVHATKSEIYQQTARQGLQPREGVVQTIAAAKQDGHKVGLVTTTLGENISAVFDGLASSVSREDFDVVVDLDDVEDRKPDPAAYRYALEQLGEQPDTTVAIEDNVGGVASAAAAGVTVVAFPNENTASHDFGEADSVVEALDPGELRRLAGA